MSRQALTVGCCVAVSTIGNKRTGVISGPTDDETAVDAEGEATALNHHPGHNFQRRALAHLGVARENVPAVVAVRRSCCREPRG